jgi:hypothetical protein
VLAVTARADSDPDSAEAIQRISAGRLASSSTPVVTQWLAAHGHRYDHCE